jgi:hypothetical protein
MASATSMTRVWSPAAAADCSAASQFSLSARSQAIADSAVGRAISLLQFAGGGP